VSTVELEPDLDLDLVSRGLRTAVACWEAYARTITGGAVHRLPGVDVGVFTDGPERDVFNNAVLGHALPDGDRTAAVDAMVATYDEAGITAYAAWIHESDSAMLDELTRRGFHHQETTWAMGRRLDGRVPEPAVEVEDGDWHEYLRVLELPGGLLLDAEPADFHVATARLEGDPVATGMVFDHQGDAGIYNVATLAHARRRGLSGSVVARLLTDAVARGCTTATLQSTEMALGVYGAAGFRDLGRILEFGPPAPSRSEGS
jgi:ribosomal protein S18 acetylase RimI-like enzyme